jgi:cellulose synthase/poly-beta-1,6-N-acetylglucosamine synthase-like glycosyltransferase
MVLFVIFVFLLWWILHGYFLYLSLMPKYDIDSKQVSDGIFSVIVVTRNEENIIAEKIKNLREIDDIALEVIFVDVSTDATPAIIESNTAGLVNFTLLRFNQAGRSHQINYALQKARGQYVFITDADALLSRNSITVMRTCFGDSNIGVIGAWVEPFTGYDPDVIFWRFYNNTRYFESMSGFSPILSGAGYAFRRDLFDKLPDDVWADDVYVPLLAHLKGYRCVCAIDVKALEHRGPLSMPFLLSNKVRKATDIIKEIIRFLPKVLVMENRWRIVYVTKVLQVICSPYLLMYCLIYIHNHPLGYLYVVVAIILGILQRFTLNYPGRKRVGFLETVFVFIVTEIVLVAAFISFLFSRKKVYHRKQL